MENTFDIEMLATISRGKKERIDDESSISNRLAVCFVAIASSEKQLLRDGSLAYEALYFWRVRFISRGGKRTLVARNGMLNVTSVYLRLNRCYATQRLI